MWSGAGSGCSAYEPKPAWQHDTGCAKRTVADVAAVADPASGLGVYDTYNSCGSSSLCDQLISLGFVQGLDGWALVGGTSLSSPVIASVYALAHDAATVEMGIEQAAARALTGVAELDRVLGAGVVPGGSNRIDMRGLRLGL